jgi:cell division septation protein DedD
MSVTVVAVVIFLCGVLVGRGVPSSGSSVRVVPGADAVVSTDIEATDDIPPAAAATPPTPLEYPEIVGDRERPDVPLRRPAERREPFTADTAVAGDKSRPAPPVVAPAVALAPTAASTSSATTAPRPAVRPTAAIAPPSAPRVAAPTGAIAPSTPGKGRYVVQVAAYRRPAEASAVEGRLKKKGYPAFVATAKTSTGALYRVRVGAYQSESEATSVADRLKREEKLEPWVIR